MKKLLIFDFDDTLFFTPRKSEEGLALISKEVGKKVSGWWGRPESLSMDLFDIPINPTMEKIYHENENNRRVLATGRIKKCEDAVKEILHTHNIFMDKYYFCDHRKTIEFKLDVFSNEIHNGNFDQVLIYDDREEHLPYFIDFRDKIISHYKVDCVINQVIGTNVIAL